MNIEYLTELYEELPPAKVKICKCTQCKAVKKKLRNHKKIRRVTSKLRRKIHTSGKIINQYYA